MSTRFLQHAADIKAAATGVGTAGVGITVSLGHVNLILGIIATFLGIVLTVFTLYWRYSEHKAKVRGQKNVKEDTACTTDENRGKRK